MKCEGIIEKDKECQGASRKNKKYMYGLSIISTASNHQVTKQEYTQVCMYVANAR